MKSINIVLLSLALLPISAWAMDCSEADQSRYSHCTDFVDNLDDPVNQGYHMLRQVRDGEGYILSTAYVCVSSNSISEFKMSNPQGEYTYVYFMGYKGLGDIISYEEYASDTFFHSGKGPADPATATIHLNPGSNAVVCGKDEMTVDSARF